MELGAKKLSLCCRCNRGGKCRNCVCVKTKSHCSNCVPLRRGCCSNTLTSMASQGNSDQFLPALPATQPPTNHLTPHPSPGSPLPVPPDTAVVVTPAESSSPSEISLNDAYPLPPPTPLAAATFTWSDLDSTSLAHSIDSAYAEIEHWRKNTFAVPYGMAGKQFVAELSRLYRAYAEGSALESSALKATTVMSILLQKPFRTSKPRHHSACLERRLSLWATGDVNNLVTEGRSLQKRLPKLKSSEEGNDNLARSFSKLMFQGKTKSALQLLSERGKGRVLHINDSIEGTGDVPTSVVDVLKHKHPHAQVATADALVEGNHDPLQTHLVIFDRIDASTIRSAALRTKGAAGPSGLDAHCWRRMCTSFKTASNELCLSLVLLARCLCTTFVDPKGLSALMACRLIALDKCPGVRPIGICETARRIIAKAVLSITRDDLQDATGSLQVCAGQIAGMEAAIHAMHSAFQNNDTEAILLVNASNAFNSLNRQAALHNIRHLCPSLAPILINSYRAATELFVDGQVLLSEEGTTQGDPLAMPMYALATIPLINLLSDANNISETRCRRKWLLGRVFRMCLL